MLLWTILSVKIRLLRKHLLGRREQLSSLVYRPVAYYKCVSTTTESHFSSHSEFFQITHAYNNSAGIIKNIYTHHLEVFKFFVIGSKNGLLCSIHLDDGLPRIIIIGTTMMIVDEGRGCYGGCGVELCNAAVV